jgi:hypothetical protein
VTFAAAAMRRVHSDESSVCQPLYAVGPASDRSYSRCVSNRRRPIRIPEDLSHAIDQDRAASAHWLTLSRSDREVLAWYVDRTRTGWGRRKRTGEVLRMLRSGESVATWQHAPAAATFTSVVDGVTHTLRDPPS